MTLTTTDGGRSLVGGPLPTSGGREMVKMIVTVPCCIGGKPFAADDEVEVDEYTARALSAVKRAVIYEEPSDGPRSGEEAPAEEGEKKIKKTKGEKA